MPGPRSLVLALALAGGCIQYDFPSGTDTSDEPGGSSSTGEPAPVVACDPLVQDCPEGQACTVLGRDFGCIEVATPGAAGDACATASECGPGLACCPGVYLAACGASACCTSLCDVADAGAECHGAGEACEALYEGDDVPSAYLNYGVCKLAD